MAGFVPPPYPYDRLTPLKEQAQQSAGGLVDLSVGTPCDPPSAAVMGALADRKAAQSYPPSVGTAPYREAAAGWLGRCFGAAVPADQVAACVGTKEFVAGLPQWLRLRTPSRDTVLYPEVSYPTYAMGATLAGCRAVAVPVDEHWRLRLHDISDADAERALCLWANTPGNPTGALDDLGAVAEWGRTHDVLVASDECYAEFTWKGPPRTILQHGSSGLLAVHSLSKRSNLAGARVGFYAGDSELVTYLSELRKHAGFMTPGPVQAAGAVAWSDQSDVIAQRARYLERLQVLVGGLQAAGIPAQLPEGAFYLWVEAPDGAWNMAERLARQAGILVSPGEFYGAAGAGHVRIAAVAPVDRIEAALARLA